MFGIKNEFIDFLHDPRNLAVFMSSSYITERRKGSNRNHDCDHCKIKWMAGDI